ncbi:MAG: hypothetical protein K2Y27_00915 [Xanthobacteraceae bacterium]|nr:hypothetical protein [Xanthobacteraceae bacterium]
MKDTILAAARALDGGRLADARAILNTIPLERSEPPLRLLATALWQRIVLASASETQTEDQRRETVRAVNIVAAAVKDSAYIWNVYSVVPALEAGIGAADAAALFATALWDRIIDAPEGFFSASFRLFHRAGGGRCLEAWEKYLAANPDYVPDYWNWLRLTVTFEHRDRTAVSEQTFASLQKTGRDDLAPLFNVYLKQQSQQPVSEIADASAALTIDAQRRRVAELMTGMACMPDELPALVRCHAMLAANGPDGRSGADFMQARLANAERRWSEAVTFALRAEQDPTYQNLGRLLRANSLARLGQIPAALQILDAVVVDKAATQDHRARAAFIRVIIERIEAGLAPPDDAKAKPFPDTSGRPLAQSLWVGKHLRWIERLAIKSYLDNGWRFQLYVYDDPRNVPDGCEVLDASAIIPEHEVFIEGLGSGLHAGSIGAFSDLFRYRLLYERGGIWTDTDVINLKRYDPDGRKFICTELSDAGMINLNGAIMAAPAHDPFVGRAYERACELLKSEEMFFTRVGPYLLAEGVVEMGADSIELMPLGFLSPVNWMNTGFLLQPHEAVSARLDVRAATNLHVYTEMWRMLGLGLDRPPPPETFLGRLYADAFGAPSE